jgi:hypothetical protein
MLMVFNGEIEEVRSKCHSVWFQWQDKMDRFHFITFTLHWEGCEHFVGYLKGEKKREILILFTWVPQCEITWLIDERNN